MTVRQLGPQKQTPLLVPRGFPSSQLMLRGEEEQIPPYCRAPGWRHVGQLSELHGLPV